MEFNEKLQELRKAKGLTQEELAEALYVSRTAVSKWESGRGYPNIDSLKAIAKLFAVTIDDLLSGEQILTIAEQDNKRREKHLHDLVFGLLDIGASLLFFLPLFAEKNADIIREVSLLELVEIPIYLKIAFYTLVAASSIFGILTLALQNSSIRFWMDFKRPASLILNVITTITFVATLQPYAAVLLFLFLIIKAILLIKWR